ncbi:MAG: DUF2169 domain-containing protein [Pseudomonadota bacterium]
MITKYVDCASLSFQATLPDQSSYGVLVAKRAYQIGRDGIPEPRPEQELLVFGDQAYGEINETSLLYPSDVVPYKPRTDIVLAANSHAPGGAPQRRWSCAVTVHGPRPLHSVLVVHGPRQWLPRWRMGTPEGFSPRGTGFTGWQLSEAEPVTQVPVRWERAWGGQNTDPADPERIVVQEGNPIGCGWIDPEMTDHTQPVPAPQLEGPDAPLNDPYQIHEPACFAPVMPAWLPRRTRGGTFDQAWMDAQRPWWPADYQFRYHNAAPDGLQVDGYLEGGETIQVFNLVEGMPECGITLPATGMIAHLGTMAVRMNMDTVLLDIRSPYPEDWLITTTWRLVTPPVMDYDITLDELDLASSRYQAARRAMTPEQVAMALRLDKESAYV